METNKKIWKKDNLLEYNANINNKKVWKGEN